MYHTTSVVYIFRYFDVYMDFSEEYNPATAIVFFIIASQGYKFHCVSYVRILSGLMCPLVCSVGVIVFGRVDTVIILNIGTDRSEQTVETQIRLLLMEQSDQGLLCLLFCLHLLNTILHCKIQLFQL